MTKAKTKRSTTLTAIRTASLAPSLMASLALLLLAAPLLQAKADSRPLYIIFDGSNSMWGELPDQSRKIETAKDVFNKLDASWFEGRDVALRLYGHRRAKDCSDTELVVPFSPGVEAKTSLSNAINAVTPRGRTPISRSLNAALKDFTGRSGEILLISDGIETCDADPCELVESWRDKNIDIRVHVVGLGLNEMARGAMQCIADASGTNYMDANSVGELVEAIESTAKAPEPGEPDPKPSTPGPEFKIAAQDVDGRFLPVQGVISKAGMEPVKIANNHRYVFDGGDYSIRVGVPTANGELYKAVSQNIKVKDSGTTKIVVTLTRPPQVRTRFLQQGEEVRGGMAYSYVNEQSGFGLRPGEEYFLMPGDYDFRASLRTDNSDLRSSLSITDGEDKDIVFNLVETVHTTFQVFNKDTGKKLRQHQQLWQNGEKKYQVHHGNGAKIRPGTYTLKSPAVLTDYEIANVEVPAVDKQTLKFDVQLGVARIHYRVQQKNPDKPDIRCWIYSVDSEGNKSARSSRMQRCDGRDIYLSEGRYLMYPTKTFGEFEDTYFDIKAGEVTVVEMMLAK